MTRSSCYLPSHNTIHLVSYFIHPFPSTPTSPSQPNSLILPSQPNLLPHTALHSHLHLFTPTHSLTTNLHRPTNLPRHTQPNPTQTFWYPRRSCRRGTFPGQKPIRLRMYPQPRWRARSYMRRNHHPANPRYTLPCTHTHTHTQSI